MQACVLFCAGDESSQCRQGGANATCLECEGKCITVHGPGRDYEKCVTGEKLEELKSGCSAQGMESVPVEEFVTDKTCLTGVTCREIKKPEADAGTGPDSWETGHEPTVESGGGETAPPATETPAPSDEGGVEPSAEAPPTGQITLIDGISNWIKELLR